MYNITFTGRYDSHKKLSPGRYLKWKEKEYNFKRTVHQSPLRQFSKYSFLLRKDRNMQNVFKHARWAVGIPTQKTFVSLTRFSIHRLKFIHTASFCMYRGCFHILLQSTSTLSKGETIKIILHANMKMASFFQ